MQQQQHCLSRSDVCHSSFVLIAINLACHRTAQRFSMLPLRQSMTRLDCLLIKNYFIVLCRCCPHIHRPMTVLLSAVRIFNSIINMFNMSARDGNFFECLPLRDSDLARSCHIVHLLNIITVLHHKTKLIL